VHSQSLQPRLEDSHCLRIQHNVRLATRTIRKRIGLRARLQKDITGIMDFALEDTQNAAPGQPTMVEQQKLGVPAKRADTQSVTKRSVFPEKVNHGLN
jgi:hypothetical protein